MDPSTPPATPAVPPRTTPTWEMELLVSGATVFGLMQLPAVADRHLFALHNVGPVEMAGLALPLWIYVQFVLYVLIGTFILHLCLRGYWVALVGLHSVYPQGVRWDRLLSKMPPYQARQARTEIPAMEQVVEAADNRATTVFGLGFGLAGVMLPPIVMVSGTLLVFLGLRALGLDIGELGYLVMIIVFLALVLPYGVLVMLDKKFGGRAPPESTAGRRFAAVYAFYARLGFRRSMNPLMTLYASHAGVARALGIMATVGVVLVVALGLKALAPRLGLDLGDYRGLPDDRTATADLLHPLHYASLRGDDAVLAPPPFIPDPVVRGPYLRLFIPYLPERHNAALRRECPEALDDTSDAGPRARLDCLARLHAPAVDGVPVRVPFDAGSDPATGHRGLVAMIPVRDLAPGRHELTIQPVVHPDRLRDAKARKPFRILFWR